MQNLPMLTMARVSSLNNVPMLALMSPEEHGYGKLWAKHDWLRPGLWWDGRTAAQKRYLSIASIKWRNFLCNFQTYCARSERKWEGQGQRQGKRRKRKRKEGWQRDAQRTVGSGFEGSRNKLLIYSIVFCDSWRSCYRLVTPANARSCKVYHGVG